MKFVAEISSNHNQSFERAVALIDSAISSNFNAVKFQLFKIEELFSYEILRKSKKHSERKKWELPLKFIPKLSKYCKSKKIQFGCTPFYLNAVRELIPYVDFLKISSYEILWDKILIECAKSTKPIILSTGMATLQEVIHAVNILKSNHVTDITLLHCVSVYPASYEEANLAAINTLRKETGCKVGWSDHTVDTGVIYRAIHHWDADTVELHYDLDGKGAEFSPGHCWLPNQARPLINEILRGFKSDGIKIKKPTFSELKDREWRADPSDGLRPLVKTRLHWK